MYGTGLVFVLLLHLCFAGTPEQGKWINVDVKKASEEFPDDFIHGFSKVSFNETKVSLKLNCTAKSGTAPKVIVRWLLRYSECADEYDFYENTWALYLTRPETTFLDYPNVTFANFSSQPMLCEPGMTLPMSETIPYKKPAVLEPSVKDDASGADAEPQSDADKQPADKGAAKVPAAKEGSAAAADAKTAAETKPDTAGKDKAADKKPTEETKATASKPHEKAAPSKKSKRAAAPPAKTSTAKASTAKAPAETKKPAKPAATTQKHCTENANVVYQTWVKGNYLFVVAVIPVSNDAMKNIESVQASVEMYYGPCEDKQYLSAIDWPLLPFYGVLCALYAFYAVGWLLMLACFWKDLLRIQFWIGGVIFLGMLEKAMFEAEYHSINQTGQSVKGLIIFAELTSCLKRTLARMLVVIVSVGFGIVKPRLGPTLHKVIGVGGLYFILSAIEGCIRVTRPKYDTAKQAMLAIIPLSVLDFAIAWWIFSSLLQTTRTLRLRRNIVKLSLYRHFTNTLIFSVVASLAFMVWFIKIKFEEGTCMRDWDEKWLDDGYWHLLFAIILLVIIVLWRPSQNNQRYAFSPLLDAAEEEDEPVMNDAFEGMKMRGTKQVTSTKDPQHKVEEDLKWIEENIPASVADTALPSLLDSDEEIMTTKFEMSKME